MYLYLSMLKQEIETTIVNATKKTKKVIKDHPTIVKVALIGGAIAFRYYYQKVLVKPDPSKFDELKRILTKIARGSSNDSLPKWIITSFSITSLFTVGGLLWLVNKKNSQLDEKNSQLDASESQKRSLSNLLEERGLQNIELNKRLQDLKNQLSTTSDDTKVRQLNEKVDQLTEELRRSSEKVKQLTEELRDSNEEVGRLTESLLGSSVSPPASGGNTLKRKSEESQKTIDQLTQEGHDKDGQINQLNIEVEQAKNELEQVKVLLQEGEAALKTSKSETEEEKKKNKALSERLEAANKRISELGEEVNKLQSTDLVGKQKEIEALTQEIKRIKSSIELNKAEQANQDQINGANSATFESLQSQVKTLEDTVARKEVTIATQEASNRANEVALQQAENTAKSIRENRDALLKLINKLSRSDINDLNQFSNEVENILNEVFAFRDKMEPIETKLIELKGLLAGAFSEESQTLAQFLNNLIESARSRPNLSDGDQTPASVESSPREAVHSAASVPASPGGALSRPVFHGRSYTVPNLGSIE